LDIYFKKRRWKRIIFLFAILIGIGSLFYTDTLVKKMSEEERLKAKAWAEATRILAESASDIFTQYQLSNDEDKYLNDVMTYLHGILVSNETIPIIVADEEGKYVLHRNFSHDNMKKLEKELERMKQKVEPIVILFPDNEKQYIYYKESSLLEALRFFPVFQLLVIIVFISISYFAFSSARQAEQNLVWVGMAKETAHQLGTPISSLIAWVELLKEEKVSQSILDEITKDTGRLQEVAERFSKIGSTPELEHVNIYTVLTESVDYLRKRIPRKIEIKTLYPEESVLYMPLSAPLFSWVIENLIRNSVDALEKGEGLITLSLIEKNNEVEIDVSDNGRGIPKSKANTIFHPGFTTKKRGWGLGLSLSKRIIHNYHKGKIFLKSSEPFVSTVFRIVLKKNPKL